MIGERIKKLRAENGMSQMVLADKIYVDKSTISSWETGKSEPYASTVKALSEVLDVSCDYLIKGE